MCHNFANCVSTYCVCNNEVSHQHISTSIHIRNNSVVAFSVCSRETNAAASHSGIVPALFIL